MIIDTFPNPYAAFFVALKPISEFSVDLEVSAADAQPDPRPFSVSSTEFFDSLYVRRSQEAVIWKSLLTEQNIILLVGERGSGKTCIGMRVMRDLQSQEPSYFLLRYDVREEGMLKPLSTVPANDIERQVLERLKERYRHSLFKYESQPGQEPQGMPENPWLKLVAYLIDPAQSKPETQTFERISVEPRIAYGRYLRDHPYLAGECSYYDWLRLTHESDLEIGRLVAMISTWDELKLSAMMHAAHAIYGFKHQVIWIDNVDALSRDQQSALQSVVRRLGTSVSKIANVMIAIRERNVYQEYTYDEMQAPPYETEVLLYEEQPQPTKAWEVALLSEEELSDIIERRVQFAHARHITLIRQLREQPPAQAADNRTATSAEHQSKPESVQQRRRQIIGSEMSAMAYDRIRGLSKQLVDAWGPIQIAMLANNSIRLILRLHHDFLKYVVNQAIIRKLDECNGKETSVNDIPELSMISSRELTTRFLSWIRTSHAGNNRIDVYDVIAEKNSWIESGKTAVGCSLEHLVLTATWNLTVSRPIGDATRYRVPTAGEVIDLLEQLGYKKKRIKEAMYSLYHNEVMRTHFLEIQAPAPIYITGSDDIKRSYHVYVTPRGKCIVRYVGNTFGYFLECLRQHDLPRGEQGLALAYHDNHVDEAKAIAHMMPHLCDIGDMHIQSLRTFRDQEVYSGPNWLDGYIRDFGIPVNVSSGIGRASGGRRRALQLEALLFGLQRYVRAPESRERLRLLQQEYARAIATLERYEEYDSPLCNILSQR